MTETQSIAWDDSVLPFQLDRSDIRGRIGRFDATLARVLEQHAYPSAVEAAVAEAVVLTALVGQTMNLRWKLSLQVRGDGPIRLIATDYFAPIAEGAPARLRAYAGFDAERLEGGGPWFPRLGRGVFGLLIDQGSGTQPYQGITPLTGDSLGDCAATYFAQSEQLPTRFALSIGRSRQPGGAEGWRAGGIMLQHMPKASPHVALGEASGEDGLLEAGDLLAADEGDNWRRANLLLDTVEEIELLGPRVTPPELLFRLFHEEQVRVFDPQALRFGCTCSVDKVRQTLSIYSARDIARMTTPEGVVTADCQFCGAHYRFDPATLGFEAQDARPEQDDR
ncbi:MAG: Hsp33 family molecular chaperone HslO [Rhodobacteraceae bacterium]|nr:Hsp33 family molecular chaperone HslO [Paracoccaceae bacterium]